MSSLQLLLLLGCAAATEQPLEQTLAPAPSSPNCVLSTAEPTDPHHIDPIKFSSTPEEAWDKLQKVVEEFPRVQLITESPSYRHYVFTTGFFRFKDDVQFLLDSEQKLIHFRSASRTGYSDLGVNRRRMEKIRRRMSEN